MPKSQIFLYINVFFLFLVFIFSFYSPPSKTLEFIFQKPKEIKVFSQLQEKLSTIKNNFENSLNNSLPEPQASFLAGLTVGTRRNLPQDFKDDLIKTGTIHVIALSGYNVTIIAQFINFIFGSFWLAVVLITLFTLMTGAAASIVRAAIMGILVLVARRENRFYNVRNALVFAASLMVFQNPKVLVWDVGFQLSFMATVGLIYFAPYFEKKFQFAGWRITNFLKIKENLIVTLSAQIAVLPLLLFYFGQFSLISILANILILPLIPISMFLGFLTGLAGFIFPPLAQLLALPAWLSLTYKIKIIEILASLPYASINF